MKRRLLMHVGVVSASHYASEALFLLRGLVLAKLLGPAAFGVWSSIRILTVFANYSHLGARQGVVQLAGVADGAADPARAQVLRRNTVGLSVVGSVVMTGAVSLYILATRPEPAWAWWMVPPMLLLAQFFDLHVTVLQSEQRFARMSVVSVLFALLSAAAGIAAALTTGLGGFLVAMTASYAVVLAHEVACGRALWRAELRGDVLRDLLRCGGPILAAQVALVVLWQSDRLVIWAALGHESLGTYAVQSYFTCVVLLIANSLVSVLQPHLAAVTGADPRPAALRPYVERGSMLVAATVAPVVVATLLALPLPIVHFLPEYAPAVVPGQVLLIATAVSVSCSVAGSVLIALGRSRLLLALRAGAAAVAVALVALVVAVGGGFVAIAAATAAAITLYSLATLTMALRRCGMSSGGTARCVARLVGVAALLVGAVAVAYAAVPGDGQTVAADVLRVLERCAVAVGLLTPVAALAWQRCGLLRREHGGGGAVAKAALS